MTLSIFSRSQLQRFSVRYWNFPLFIQWFQFWGNGIWSLGNGRIEFFAICYQVKISQIIMMKLWHINWEKRFLERLWWVLNRCSIGIQWVFDGLCGWGCSSKCKGLEWNDDWEGCEITTMSLYCWLGCDMSGRRNRRVGKGCSVGSRLVINWCSVGIEDLERLGYENV